LSKRAYRRRTNTAKSLVSFGSVVFVLPKHCISASCPTATVDPGFYICHIMDHPTRDRLPPPSYSNQGPLPSFPVTADRSSYTEQVNITSLLPWSQLASLTSLPTPGHSAAPISKSPICTMLFSRLVSRLLPQPLPVLARWLK
jgi:hypothetical protein